MKHLRYILFLLLALSAGASTLYVNQNGISPNTNSLTWLNSTYGWTAGDTISLSGKFTNSLTIGGSGTAGNPITILFEPGANFTAPVWPIAIDLKGASYITIDGGVNGLIEATDSGTLLGYTNTETVGVSGNGNRNASGAGITIQNLTISNLYVAIPQAGYDQRNIKPVIQAIQLAASTGNDYLIRSNRIYQGGNSVVFMFSGNVTNVVIADNTINKTSLGIFITSSATGYSDGFQVLRNNITDFSPYGGAWSENGQDHNDGIHINAAVSLTNYNMLVMGNYIGGDASPYLTSAIKSTPDYPAFQNRIIVNNVICFTNGAGNGEISVSYNGLNNDLIANNTIVSAGSFSCSSALQMTWTNSSRLLNNFCYGMAINISESDTYGSGGYHHPFSQSDFNSFSVIQDANFATFADSQISFNAWQANGFDLNSQTNTPSINATFQPNSGDTVLIGNGTNLYSLGITNDFNGNPRPATGPWTIGAFEINLVGEPTNILFTLTVIGGTGSGSYTNTQQVPINTNSTTWSAWSPSVLLISNDPTTYLTMPSNNYTITAIYTNVPTSPSTNTGGTINIGGSVKIGGSIKL